MEADLPKGVRLTRTVGTFGERMAEYALASILAVRQHLHLYRDDQHSRSWSPRLAVPLHGARLGVAGYGAIGRSLAVAAERFGMRVHGLARRARRDEGRDVLATDQLQAFVSRSDIVVNVLPRTPNTTRLFDDVAFRAMPEGAWFLNMGRGATVDQTALVDALRDGHLGGAVLDVFETEPLPREDPLWSMPNVIVTPHVAGTTDPREVVDAFEQNVPHFRAGDPMHDEVDRHRGY
jgi:glyoxylate/hydroxypyruvate reductase A